MIFANEFKLQKLMSAKISVFCHVKLGAWLFEQLIRKNNVFVLTRVSECVNKNVPLYILVEGHKVSNLLGSCSILSIHM